MNIAKSLKLAAFGTAFLLTLGACGGGEEPSGTPTQKAGLVDLTATQAPTDSSAAQAAAKAQAAALVVAAKAKAEAETKAKAAAAKVVAEAKAKATAAAKAKATAAAAAAAKAKAASAAKAKAAAAAKARTLAAVPEDDSSNTSYANCSEVRAAGAAPIRAGDPGFEKKFDRDGDGVGCE